MWESLALIRLGYTLWVFERRGMGRSVDGWGQAADTYRFVGLVIHYGQVCLVMIVRFILL